MNKKEFIKSFNFNLRKEGVTKLRFTLERLYHHECNFDLKSIEGVYDDMVEYDLLTRINELNVEYITEDKKNEVNINRPDITSYMKFIEEKIFMDKNKFNSIIFDDIDMISRLKINIENNLKNIKNNDSIDELISDLIIFKFISKNLKQK